MGLEGGSGGRGGGKWGERGREVGIGYPPVHPLLFGREELLRPTKLIFVCYIYYCFRIFAPGMYDTSYLHMQHLDAGHIYFFVSARFKRACTLEASLQTFWIYIGTLSQTLN